MIKTHFGTLPISNEALFKAALSKYKFNETKQVSMLPFKGIVGNETRRLYFQRAIGEDGLFRTVPILTEIPEGKRATDCLQVTRLFSFGKCNAYCPYCKRDMQFIDDEGNVIAASDTDIKNLFEMAEGAVNRGEVVRFSGGDPVKFPTICYSIAEYVKSIGGTVSIAHNGSGPSFVEKLLPFMSSAAIDIKGPERYMGVILGLSDSVGLSHFKKSFECQKLFSDFEKNPNKAVLDVRTPIFGYHPNPDIPQTTIEDMRRLADLITKTNNPRITFWTWRLYKQVKGCDWNTPDLEDTLEMMQRISEEYPNQWMGIRAKWHDGGMLYFYNGSPVNVEQVDVEEPIGSGNTGECVTY